MAEMYKKEKTIVKTINRIFKPKQELKTYDNVIRFLENIDNIGSTVIIQIGGKYGN